MSDSDTMQTAKGRNNFALSKLAERYALSQLPRNLQPHTTTATGRWDRAYECTSFGSTTVKISQRAVSAGFGEFSISIVTS
jgi:hypothetical protein